MVKLNEGYLDDYEKFKKKIEKIENKIIDKGNDAFVNIKDFFQKFKINGIFHTIEIKILDKEYNIEGIYYTTTNYIRIDYYIEGSRTTLCGDLMMVEPDILCAVWDYIEKLEPQELLEIVAIGGNFDSYNELVKEYGNEWCLEWHIGQMLEVNEELVKNITFLKFAIDNFPSCIKELKEFGADFKELIKSDKKYEDLLDAEELGLL